jgi:hypothetical protein
MKPDGHHLGVLAMWGCNTADVGWENLVAITGTAYIERGEVTNDLEMIDGKPNVNGPGWPPGPKREQEIAVPGTGKWDAPAPQTRPATQPAQ